MSEGITFQGPLRHEPQHLALIRHAGTGPRVIEYLKTLPPTKEVRPVCVNGSASTTPRTPTKALFQATPGPLAC